MTPEAIRKQQERQRRKDAGLVRREMWVTMEQDRQLAMFQAWLKSPEVGIFFPAIKRKKETA